MFVPPTNAAVPLVFGSFHVLRPLDRNESKARFFENLTELEKRSKSVIRHDSYNKNVIRRFL